MNKSIVNFDWDVDENFPFPKDSQFYCTGYSGKTGKKGMFSVVVKFLDFDGETKNSKQAEVFALADEMEDSLPLKGELFYFTSGAKVVASGTAIKRTF